MLRPDTQAAAQPLQGMSLADAAGDDFHVTGMGPVDIQRVPEFLFDAAAEVHQPVRIIQADGMDLAGQFVDRFRQIFADTVGNPDRPEIKFGFRPFPGDIEAAVRMGQAEEADRIGDGLDLPDLVPGQGPFIKGHPAVAVIDLGAVAGAEQHARQTQVQSADLYLDVRHDPPAAEDKTMAGCGPPVQDLPAAGADALIGTGQCAVKIAEEDTGIVSRMVMGVLDIGQDPVRNGHAPVAYPHPQAGFVGSVEIGSPGGQQAVFGSVAADGLLVVHGMAAVIALDPPQTRCLQVSQQFLQVIERAVVLDRMGQDREGMVAQQKTDRVFGRNLNSGYKAGAVIPDIDLKGLPGPGDISLLQHIAGKMGPGDDRAGKGSAQILIVNVHTLFAQELAHFAVAFFPGVGKTAQGFTEAGVAPVREQAHDVDTAAFIFGGYFHAGHQFRRVSKRGCRGAPGRILRRRRQGEAFRGFFGLRDPVHRIMIGQGQGGKAQFPGHLYKLGRRQRPVGFCRMCMQVNRRHDFSFTGRWMSENKIQPFCGAERL